MLYDARSSKLPSAVVLWPGMSWLPARPMPAWWLSICTPVWSRRCWHEQHGDCLHRLSQWQMCTAVVSLLPSSCTSCEIKGHRSWDSEWLFILFKSYQLCCVFLTPVDVSLVPSVLWHCWLGGRKGIQPVKNWVVGCWHGYLSGAMCRLAYGPADATATHCL